MGSVATVKPGTIIEAEAANSVMGLLKRYGSSIKGALPKSLQGDRFAWIVVNNIRQNPKLAECTPGSFVNAVMLAANMGLEIRRNSAYLVPYGKECQLLVDYRGKLDLMRRAGGGEITLELVHEGDAFGYSRSESGLQFHFQPLLLRVANGRNVIVPDAERGEVVLGFGLAQLPTGKPQFEVMTLSQIEAIRRRAKSGCGVAFQHYGKDIAALTLAEIRQKDAATMGFRDPYRVPWVTDWDQMARKTIAHRLANYTPQSSELVLSQEIDDATDTGKPMPVAPEMVDLLEQLDPADNHPMVSIPDSDEERRAAQIDIAAQKTGKSREQVVAEKPAKKTTPPPLPEVPVVNKLPDAVPLIVGTRMAYGGTVWTVANSEHGHIWEKT